MAKDKKMIISCSDARFITTKTGTHVVYYDVVSGRQRRINLTNYSVYGIKTR